MPKKSKKMDPKLVAARQKSEVSYISKRFKIPTKVVGAVVKKEGRSRAKIYAALRKMGYKIPTRRAPK